MKHFYSLVFCWLLLSVAVQGQTDTFSVKKDTGNREYLTLIKDSINEADSLIQIPDSSFVLDSIQKIINDSIAKKKISGLPVESKTKEGSLKFFSGKEELFYYLIFLLILFGSFRLAFIKYFKDFFRVFFRTTLNQKQIREQLLQSPLPSVLMNFFFVLSAGLYINFILIHFDLVLNQNFWIQYIYCMGALSGIYIIKFLGLKITGWLFNLFEATDSYIFIVFIINKMIGLVLLPINILLAFTSDHVYYNSLIFSWFLIGVLYLYRRVLSIGIARAEIKLKLFHFFLYIIAFELIPLLLIYKLLLIVF